MSMIDGKTFEENSKMVVPWKVEGKFNLRLLTIEEYNQLPLGTILGCISGETKIKSEDSNSPESINYINQDTRYGRLAYGLIDLL